MSLIEFTAAATFSLTAAATLGNGWMCLISTNGSDITVDPNSTEQVNGATTENVPDGCIAVIICDGSEFWMFKVKRAQSDPPVGAVLDYAGSSAPAGYLLAYGQAISRTTYADLFDVIGTTYGVGDGSTTFNLPDLRGRVVAGQDDMGGTSADRLTDQSGGLDGDVLGDTGGAETHALAEAELAQHLHSVSITSGTESATHTHSQGTLLNYGQSGTGTTFQAYNAGGVASGTESATHTHLVSGNTGNTGSSTAHNNVQPTIILNKIIKY